MLNVQLNDYDILIITESWLPENITDVELGLTRYNIFRCDRNYKELNTKRGGGVLIAIDKAYRAFPIGHKNDSGFECLFVKVWFCYKPILLNATYIPPSANVDTYLELSSYIDSVLQNHKFISRFLLMGDFNLSSTEWVSLPDSKSLKPLNTDTNADNIIEITHVHSLNQYNHIKNVDGRCLDLIFTNLDTLSVCESDHPLSPIDPPHPPLSITLYLDKDQRMNNSDIKKKCLQS